MQRLPSVAGRIHCGPVAADELDQRLAAANPKRGQLLYMQCKACHDAEPGLPAQAGPNLNGGFGRTAGTAPGFKYTGRDGEVWRRVEYADAGHFHETARALIPGNGMRFRASRTTPTGQPHRLPAVEFRAKVNGARDSRRLPAAGLLQSEFRLTLPSCEVTLPAFVRTRVSARERCHRAARVELRAARASPSAPSSPIGHRDRIASRLFGGTRSWRPGPAPWASPREVPSGGAGGSGTCGSCPSALHYGVSTAILSSGSSDSNEGKGAPSLLPLASVVVIASASCWS